MTARSRSHGEATVRFIKGYQMPAEHGPSGRLGRQATSGHSAKIPALLGGVPLTALMDLWR
jgi:hypothetical protein